MEDAPKDPATEKVLIPIWECWPWEEVRQAEVDEAAIQGTRSQALPGAESGLLRIQILVTPWREEGDDYNHWRSNDPGLNSALAMDSLCYFGQIT